MRAAMSLSNLPASPCWSPSFAGAAADRLFRRGDAARGLSRRRPAIQIRAAVLQRPPLLKAYTGAAEPGSDFPGADVGCFDLRHQFLPMPTRLRRHAPSLPGKRRSPTLGCLPRRAVAEQDARLALGCLC